MSDIDNYRIQMFDAAGSFLTKWGSPGTGDGQFQVPNGVAVAGDGSVYVADEYNHRIQVFWNPADRIEVLKDQVEQVYTDGVIDSHVHKGLIGKLNEALKKLDKPHVAINKLNDFILQVEGALPAEVGQPLIHAAQKIIDGLSV